MEKQKNLSGRDRGRWRRSRLRRRRVHRNPIHQAKRSRTVLLVTGEASGDLHGAELAHKLWRFDRSLHIIGMGGERMQKAGVKILFDNRRLGVMGLVEVIGRWRAIREAYRTIRVEIQKRKIDLVVLIDSPDFNFRVAKVAKVAAIPIVYYIGPKVWAWRSGRVKTLSKLVDKMLVILPFEEEIYQGAGVSCRFVGHPLLDEIPQDLDPVYLRQQYGVKNGNPVVALLPGSRFQEIKRLMPVMLSSAKKLRKKMPEASFLLAVAPSVDWNAIERMVKRSGVPVKMVSGEAPKVLACSDAAIVASGTATLEAALVGTPMVIVYRMAWLTYAFARMLVHIEHIGLVNIIAKREVAPELIQSKANANQIGKRLMPLLNDWEIRKQMKRSLVEISRNLGTPGASARAAREVLKILYKKSPVADLKDKDKNITN